jgi:peptidoglycan-associated lipoprotein
MNFNSALIRRLALVMTVFSLVAATGCSKKQKDDENTAVNDAMAGDTNPMGDSDSGKAMGLQTVHFPYDSFTLDGGAKGTLSSNAEILKANAGLKVQIEGHCDQRGGIQYNIALGEKRANSAKKFLEDAGIAGDRITTISYGKERPLDAGNTEEAHSKNRRANFAVTSK